MERRHSVESRNSLERRRSTAERRLSISSVMSEDSITMEDAFDAAEEAGRVLGSAVGLSRMSSVRGSRRERKIRAFDNFVRGRNL